MTEDTSPRPASRRHPDGPCRERGAGGDRTTPARDRGDRRAVSDVIGYVLVFSLVVSTISIVYLGGLGGLEDSRDAEQLRNTERAFDVLADNLADIHREGAPSRATEIKLTGGELSYGEATVATVEFDNLAVSPVSVSFSPLVYQSGDTSIVYEGGATLRVDGDSGVMNNRPPFLFIEEGGRKTAVVSVVDTRQQGATSVGGETTVLVRSELVVNQVLEHRRTPGNVSSDAVGNDDPDTDGNDEYQVTLTWETTPERAPVWLDQFRREIPASFAADTDGDDSLTDETICELTTSDVTDDTVTCTVSVERITVTSAGIENTYEV